MSAVEPVVLPVGQDLGPVNTADGLRFRVAQDIDLYEMTRERYLTWRAAHGDITMTNATWDVAMTAEMAHRQGIADPESELQSLIDDQLVHVVAIATDEPIEFAVQHRLEARMPLLGPSADLDGGVAVGLPGIPLAVADADAANIWLYGSAYDSLWDTVCAVSQVTPSQVPAEVRHIERERMLVEKFLMDAYELLSSGAMCFKRIVRIEGDESR